MVEVIPRWYVTGDGTEIEATYVVYSFAAGSLITNGNIDLSDPGRPPVVTEIWRYANSSGTWCNVVGNLPMSVATAKVLLPDNPAVSPVGDPTRLLVGTADGVLGVIAFTDNRPQAQDCEQYLGSDQQMHDQFAPAGPVASGGTPAYYTPINVTGKVGAISAIKMYSIMGPDNRPAPQYAHMRVVFTWGGISCAIGSGYDTNSNDCTDNRPQPLTVTRISTDGTFLDTAPAFPSGDPRAALVPDNKVRDFDAYFSADAAGNTQYWLNALFYNQPALSATTASAPASTAATFNAAPTGWTQTASFGDHGWPNAQAVAAVGGSLGLDPSLFLQSIVGGDSTHSTGVVASAPAFQNVQLVTYFAYTPYGLNTANILTTRYAAAATRFTQLDASGFNNLVSVTSSASSSPSGATVLPWEVANSSSVARDGSYNPGTVPLYDGYASSVPGTFYSTFQGDNGQTFSGVLFHSLSAVVVPNKAGTRLRAYVLLGAGDMSNAGNPDISFQAKRVGGGVYLCVLTPDDLANILSGGACKHPRPVAAGEAQDGFVAADYTAMFPTASYQAAPALVRYSVSPSANVFVYVVNEAGAIVRINATEGSTDWTASDKSWVTISGGRPARCYGQLVKPAAPPQNPAPKQSWWKKAISKIVIPMVAAGVGAIEIESGGVLAAAAMALAATDIDIGGGELFDYMFDKKDDQSQSIYQQWQNVYDGVGLNTVCTPG
ncbi:hypothetical protein [Ottowia sp.]|uniref:hypothetical protein n=1 Tax=Ottowia sp. TaxID=1898956 RepID=UPI002BFA73A9|nr:hypothetical protein [Ottowia sp.]HOB67788.1 hypothetical protein [Ottowia sp.]HPZ58507.1 hypothetical protein [Ottowia sp.]HQD47794.1 hypothetical protein [Ottowia sp.]